MSQHEGGIDGRSAENLSGFSVIEGVKTVPEGLAIEGDAARLRSLVGGVEPRGMLAKPVPGGRR